MRRLMTRSLAVAACSLLMTACTGGDGFFFLRNQGADMPVWIRGNTGSGTILLFVHGGPGNNSLTYSGKDAFRTLERDVAVAYWDQRASGSSRGEAKPASLTLDQFVADLDGVVDGLRQTYAGSRIVLLGYSWGGALGPAYLADTGRQAKIAGWIELDGAHSIVDGNRLSVEVMRNRVAERIAAGQDVARWQAAQAFYQTLTGMTVAQFPQHLQYVNAMEQALAPTPGTPLPTTLGLNLFSPFNGLTTMANASFVEANMVLTPAFLALHLTPQLARITLPALVLWGENDCRLPVSMAKEAFDALGTPAAQKAWRTFPRSAHTPFLNEPEAFVESVRPFLARL